MFYEVLHEYSRENFWLFVLWLVILSSVICEYFGIVDFPRLTVPGGIAILIAVPPLQLIRLWRIARDREKEIDAAWDIEEKKNKWPR